MRTIITFLFVFLFVLNGYSQEAALSLSGKLKIGYISDNTTICSVNKDQFIDLINKSFFEGKSVIDRMTIETDYTIGDEKRKYYYLQFTSTSTKNLYIVRWLFNYDNELFIDSSSNTEYYTYVELYITCKGGDSCKPRLYETGDGSYSWGCREFLGCVTEEESKKNKCTQTNTGF